MNRLLVNLALGLFAALLLVGLAGLYALDLRPRARLAASANWLPVACTVVRAGTGEDGHGWWGAYTYVIDGIVHRSERLAFWPGNIDRPIAVGERHTGLVDPAHPDEAVLLPDYRPDPLLRWVVYGWVVLAAIGSGQYLLVRLGRMRLRTSYAAGSKRYYHEM